MADKPAQQFLSLQDLDPDGTLDIKPAETSTARRVGDAALGLARGAIGVPEAAVGLADIATGGKAGKVLENEGGAFGFRPKQAKEFLAGFDSPALKDSQWKFQNADGVVDKTIAAVQNPSVVANAVVESAPLMAGGGVMGQLASKVMPTLGRFAGAIGEGFMGAGSAAEAIRQETDDGLLTGKQAAIAAGTGLGIGVLGAGGRAVAQKLGVGDVDQMIAAGSRSVGGAATAAAPGVVSRAGRGALSEGVFEELPQSLVEQGLQNEALDRPLGEGMADAAVLGTLSGASMGAGAGVLSTPAAPAATVPPVAPIAPAAPPAAPKASAAMGIDPLAGPVSAAAATAVDGGATAVVKAQEAAAAAAEQAEKDAKTAGKKGARKVTEPVRKPEIPDPFATAPAAAPVAATGPLSSAAVKAPTPVQPPATTEKAPTDGTQAAQTVEAEAQGPQPTTAATPAVDEQDDAPLLESIRAYNDDLAGMASPSSVSSRFGITTQRAKAMLAKLEKPAAEAEQPDAQAEPEWQTFSPETGTLNVPRAEMPQIKTVHRGAMVNFLKGRGITSEQAEVDPGTLKPTQTEYSPAKVKKALGFTGEDRSILVSSDGHVLDGHHQWLVKMASETPVKVIRLNAPIAELLPLVREFPSSTVDESTADVQNPKEAEATGSEPAEAARVEAPAPEGRDAAAAEGVPAARPAAVEAPGVAAPTKAEIDKITIPDMTDAQVLAGPALYGKDHKRTPKLEAEALKRGLVNAQKPAASAGGRSTNAERPLNERPANAKPSATAPVRTDTRPTETIEVQANKSGVVQSEITLAKLPSGKWASSFSWQDSNQGTAEPIRTNGPVYATRDEAIDDAVDRAIESIGDKSPALAAKFEAKRPSQPAADAPAPAPEKPKRGIIAKADEVRKARADFFTPGNIVKSYGGIDEVLAYQSTDGGGFNVTVHEVTKVGDQWHRVGKPQDARRHSTQPDARALAEGPIERLGFAPAAEVVYTSPRADGQPFPNAVDRGTAPATDKPNGRLQAERDANPVILFGRAMNDAGLEFDGNDPRAWSAEVGKKGEVHARMEDRPNGATVYRVYSFFDGKETGDTTTSVNLPDAEVAIRDQRSDLLERERSEAVKALDEPWSDNEEKSLQALIGRNGGVTTKDMGGHFNAEVSVSNNDTKGVRAAGKTSLSAKRALLKKLSTEATGKAPAPKPAPAVSANTVFTEDAAEKARARLKAKLGRLNSGVDPEMLMDGITLAGYHIEKGARTFAAFARAMVDDLGDGVKPFLKSWYMGVKYDPRAGVFDGLDGAGVVEAADVDALTAPKAPVAAPAPAPTEAKARTLTESLYQAISAGNMPKDNPGLKKLVESFDGQAADQARMKQAQEELETAIAMSARDIVAKGQGDQTTFGALLRLYESQPNLNIRTSTSIANQAYSTPAPLAYLASRLAGVTRTTVVHEPTAGTGMLLIGADQKRAIVNELNDVRITALKSQGFAPTQKDAATQALVPVDTNPDAVVTNPPFGSVKDADGKPVKVKVDGFNIGQIDHLIAARALDTMKESGRATLILGANKAAGGLSTDDRIFFNWLYSHYNVVGHFEVEGDLYTRQGAGWPVRVITINGRQKSSKISPVAGTVQRVDNWEQVYEQFTQSLNAAEAARIASPAADAAGERSPSAGAPSAGAGGRRPASGTRGAGDVAGSSPRAVPDRAEPAAEPVAPVADEQRLNAQPYVPQAQPGQGAAGSDRPAQPAGNAAVDGAVASQGNEFQSPYTPRSARKDEGVLIPANMAQATQDALSRLEDDVGDIDEFARVELGYDSVEQLHGALMGLQVDSVATAIHQIKQGKAVVIADQTGIGKGRQAASIIRWAARQGMTPVFVSVKPSLFTDMYGDLADIGTSDVTPFIMNGDAWVAGDGGAKLFANKPATHKRNLEQIATTGELPSGSNALFMTYSQINTSNMQRQALMALAPNAVFVLDESHNAAGESATGQFIIDTLDLAKGVTYLSATYAKRPDNMPLYFKTDIGEAAADTEGLAVAMAYGGLPLQTVVSNNLVKAGQMFRRERSYDGVSIASVFDSPNRALHERMSNEATKALRAIVAADRMFHAVYVKQLAEELATSGATVKDSAGNQLEAGVQHTEFSSVVHNFVKQMLLGLKAQSAADEAIASLKRGEKPIIAVENTMGSFLNEYAAANGVGQGESLGKFDYRTVLSRALERSRVIIEVAPNGEKVKRQVSLAMLDAQTRAEYESAKAVIDGLTLEIPVSPIDWMRAEISRAGFNVAEITGRNLSVDYTNPKKPILSAIDTQEQKDKVNTTRRFNGGKLDALILNVAGSTGISLHASEKFEDQRQRHMIVAQAAGDINIFMQMLGRVHRTGQVRLPKYTILSVDLPTEKRPTAVLSIKMKSLNANTSSNTESATSVKTADILNKYGDQIVNQYLRDNYALARALGLEGEIGDAPSEDIARKATGRLALQPIDTQTGFYEDVEAQYASLIDYLNKTNQNDLEPRTFDFDAKEVRQEVLFDGPNKASPFGEDAIYGEYSIKAQGTPMKPDEIRAAMAANLGELTPAAYTQQMLEGLDAKFNAYYSTLDDAAKDAASSVRGMGRDFMSRHAIGSTFRVEINSEPFNAVVINVRNAHKTTGNPYSMSKIQLTVALNGALRSLSVPATQFNMIEVSSIAPMFRIEQLFKEQPPNQRETAKIITGNLLAAYGEMQGVRGTIITFTKQDGTSEQGILLPKLFDYSKNTRGDYRLVDGAAALKFLQQSENRDIGRIGIMTRDGVVRVLPSAQGVRVQVPKSKLKGGKYFLDKALIAAAGDFVSAGNYMTATVHSPADAVKALDLLMKKQALYALPSMAEEAKQLTGASDTAFKIDGATMGGDTATYGTIDARPEAEYNIGVLGRDIAAVLKLAPGEVNALRPYDARVLDGDAALREIGEAFGSEVQGFGLRRGLGEAERQRFGFFAGVRTSGTVFLRSEGGNRPHLAVLGHELAHELATKNKVLYGRLVAAIQPYVDVAKYQTEFVNSTVARNVKDPLKKQEEFIGEVLSDGFMDRDFWRALGNKNPSLLRQIGGLVMDLVETVLKKVGYTKQSEKYLTDYKAVMRLAGEVMAEYGVSRASVGNTMFSRIADENESATRFNMTGDFKGAVNSARDVALPAGYIVNDFLKTSGKLNLWHKTVGTQFNLAQRSKPFKRVFDAAQTFLNDVSYFANEAANLAPKILPKMETLKDIAKSPISAQDNKAIAAPIFEGTLTWARDPMTRKPVSMEVLEARAAKMTTADKAQALLRASFLSPRVMNMWQGLPVDQYESLINGKYERDMLKAGIVFTPDELKSMFKLTDGQVGLYQEFRAATDKSLTQMVVADMVRFGGTDVIMVKEEALAAGTPEEAAIILRDFLLGQAEAEPERAAVLTDTANKMLDKAARITDLIERGYAPLSRFGNHSLDVVDEDGERVYFGLFESEREANRMARQMKSNYPNATMRQGTMSQESYKLFAGVSPETLELFGEMLGLESQGDEAKDKAFQEYIKLAKAQRSAMKRLIHRKGISGFSEDPGRVLAGFVYSNARQASSALHMGEITKATSDMPQGDGEIKDAALRLTDYVKNPQEEAQQFRSILFAQYLGGSVASAMLNAMQPLQVTFPWLSQYGGAMKAAGQMKRAIADVLGKRTLDARLAAAMKKAEEDGIVSPQEIFQLQAQAAGRATLQSGDGTRAGDAMATANNAMSKVALAWGKLFGAAEQFNRRSTFIAAFRTAVEQGMPNPESFAERAVNETQFIYSKANKPRWARGAVGSILFTFKQYSVSYVELMHRMATQGGPEGKKAALLGLAVLFLMSGADGLPFAEDVQDLIDGVLQRLGYNTTSRQAKEDFFREVLGEGGAQFMLRGASGLPGSPVDVSGRMGLGNLLPATGLLKVKDNYSRDLAELAGPGGDLVRRGFEAAEKAMGGDILGSRGALMTISPTAARNLGMAYEMGVTGMYLDRRGKKVIDVDATDAMFKAIGIQPADVARVQDASFEVQGMSAFNRMSEAKIADKWAKGVFMGDMDMVAEARDDVKSWNARNPKMPIVIKPAQIASRVKQMRMSKADRIAKTAPAEIRARVREDLARAGQ